MQKLLLTIFFTFIGMLALNSHADEPKKSRGHEECVAYVNQPWAYDECRFGPGEYTGPWDSNPKLLEFIDSVESLLYSLLAPGAIILIGTALYRGSKQAKHSPQIHFENPRTGQSRMAVIGFSWTTLLFGPFPMVFRSNWKRFVIVLLIGCVTFFLSNVFFAFTVNRMHVQDLLNDGFKVKSVWS